MSAANEAVHPSGERAGLFCTFHLDRWHFGVDVADVQEVIRSTVVTPTPLAPAAVAGLVNLRGRIVTAIDLRVLLGLGAPGTWTAPPVNIVVQTPDGLFALLVDRVGDVVRPPLAASEPPPGNLDAGVGAYVRDVWQLPQGLMLELRADALTRIGTLRHSTGQEPRDAFIS